MKNDELRAWIRSKTDTAMSMLAQCADDTERAGCLDAMVKVAYDKGFADRQELQRELNATATRLAEVTKIAQALENKVMELTGKTVKQ